jgi:hypothetical protein
MYALVIDGTITKYFSYPKGFTLGDNQYPADIFMKWSVEEKEAIGIYEVVFDDSNKKDEKWYINTNQSFAFADGTVTASYGTATAKAHADTTWSQDDEDAGLLPSDKSVGDIKTRGLKYNLIQTIKQQASGLLAPTDWYVVKANEVEGYTIPTAISTFRTEVRAVSNQQEAQIKGCTTVEQLKALYEYTNTGTEQNPVMTRPLPEFPKEVI